MKVQSDYKARHGMPSHGQNHPALNLHSPRPGPSGHQEISQLRALKSEYDNMEESLRDALRHGNRQNHHPKPDNSRSVGENAFNSHHNHMPAYDHERQTKGYRSFPNSAENFRHPSVGHQQPKYFSAAAQPSALNHQQISNTDEIRRYCALLTERIQEVERQNLQLLRFSESQKAEYDKVTAQVIESERSQRHLLNECSNLRRQVRQLATHNKRLKEQKLFNSNPNSPTSSNFPRGSGSSSPGNFFERDHPTQHCASSGIEPFLEALRHLHSASDQRGANNSSAEASRTPDVAAVIEWYSALQKATISDFRPPDASNSPNGKNFGPDIAQPPIPSLDISDQRRNRSRRDFGPSDYASPSSICATASCSCCTARSGNKTKSSMTQLKHPHQEEHSAVENVHHPNQQRASKRIRSLESKRSHQDPTDQSFDNQAYVEVEIKQKQPISAPQEMVHPPQDPNTQFNFNRDNELRRSHDHFRNVEANPQEVQKPSSLALDAEATQEMSSPHRTENQFQPALRPRLSNSDGFHHTEESDIQNKSSSFPAAGPENVRDVWYSRKYSSSSVGETRLPPKTNAFSKRENKSTIRSSSISDLPSPPPAPPGAKTQLGENVGSASLLQNLAQSGLSQRARSSSADAATTDLKQARSKPDKQEETQPKRNKGFSKKLSLWKSRSEAQQQHLAEKQKESKPQNKPCGYRRGSYAAACRKSQSLDHLYEQALRENEKMRKLAAEQEKLLIDAMEVVSSGDFQTDQTSQAEAPTSPAPESVEKSDQRTPSEKKSDDDVFAPPPKFAFHPSTQSNSPYEIMSPLKGSAGRSNYENLQPQKRFEHRHHSEVPGLTGNKFCNEADCSHVRRHQSVGNDVIVNKRKDVQQNQPLSTTKLHPCTSGSQELREKAISSQLRFPTANVYPRSQEPVVNQRPGSESAAQSRLHLKPCDLMSNQPLAAVLKTNEIRLPQQGLLHKNTSSPKHVTAPPVALKAVVTNETLLKSSDQVPDCNESKDSAPFSGESKKKTPSSSGKESKSFVDIMKAKFSRSSAGSRSSAAKKKSNEKNRDPLPKPGNRFIDPRTLSLEPNSQPPQDKGRSSVKKVPSQKLGENSDAAVGRKLSQPFPNGVGEGLRSKPQLNAVAEEVLSDEGFAEGSTIERTEKERYPACDVGISEETKPLPRPIDSTSSNFSRDMQLTKSSVDSNNLKNRNIVKTKSPESYENVVGFKKEVKTPKENKMNFISSDQGNLASVVNTRPAKQKRTKHSLLNGPLYENFPLEENLASRSVENYENSEINFQENQESSENLFRSQQDFIGNSSPKCHGMRSFLDISPSTSEEAVSDKKCENSCANEDVFTRGTSSSAHDKDYGINELTKDPNQSENSSKLTTSILTTSIPADAPIESDQRLRCPNLSTIRNTLATESAETETSFGSLPSDGIPCSQIGNVSKSQNITPLVPPSSISEETNESLKPSGFSTHMTKSGSKTPKDSILSSELCLPAKHSIRKPGVLPPKPTVLAKPSGTKTPFLLAKEIVHENSRQPLLLRTPVSALEKNALANSKTIETPLSMPKVYRSTSNKLPSPGEVTECRDSTKKISHLPSPTIGLNQPSSTKSPQGNSGPTQSVDTHPASKNESGHGWLSEPLYENASAIEEQRKTENTNLVFAAQRKTIPQNDGSQSPDTYTSDQVDIYKSKNRIPSSAELHRYRSVKSRADSG